MKDKMIDENEKQNIVPLIVGVLETKIGVNAAIKGHYIIGYLSACRYEVNPGRFRLMINYIRSNDLVIGLVATGKGYYRTDDPEEIKRWVEKEKGIIKQKVGPIKRMKLYLHELANRPQMQMK